jgi:GNAT superfamily N-acetyltransferase
MTSEGILIRTANLSDADTLVEFNRAMALETENRRLDPTILREGILTFLGDPRYGFYTVAMLPGVNAHKPIGQLMITYEWSDWRNGLFWWIQSVYVVPVRRGQGVFRAMHDHTLAKAKADPQVCGIRLYVERENRRAQSVYQRVGLSPAGYAVYEQDFVLGPPTQNIMKEEIP